MKTVGDKLETFSVVGVKARLQPARRKKAQSAFEEDHREIVSGKMEGDLLLSEGFHVRVPDGDRRLREAREGLRGPRRRVDGRLDGQRVLQARVAARA